MGGKEWAQYAARLLKTPPLPWIASSGEEGGEVSGVTSENELEDELLLDDAMAPRAPY
jgi:hypothetical protein